MITNTKFEDIRPYYDSEIPAAMERITKSVHFPLLASYVYPNMDIEEVRRVLLSFNNTRDFQLEVMRCVNEQVIERTISEFTYSGIEGLDCNKRYLFVSNHRDIMLDACLLQYILYKHNHETSEITFGANLMSGELVIDIGKSNKMFRVERGGSMKDFYNSSKHLSEYIRHTITEKGQSVWIAQRNGRTKDGIDRTDQGIIKMFGMSGAGTQADALASLNIVPVAVSYEWESCDILKAVELYKTRRGPYVKKEGEDLNSILTGILQPKGRVHIAFCQPITQADLAPLETMTSGNFHRAVAALMDKRIIEAYRLTPNNYIACDLLSGESVYADHYTEEDKQKFEQHLSKLDTIKVDNPQELREILLGIYANPVKDKKI